MGEDDDLGAGVGSTAFFLPGRLREEHLLWEGERQFPEALLNFFERTSHFLFLSLGPRQDMLFDEGEVFLFGDNAIGLQPGGSVEGAQALHELVARREQFLGFVNGGEIEGAFGTQFELAEEGSYPEE